MPAALGSKQPTTIPWADIRAAVESGVTIRQACKKWGVSYEAGRKRSQREGWYVPATLMAEARERLAKSGVEVPIVSLRPVESVSEAKTARAEVGTALLESAQELAEDGSMIGLRLLHGQLKDAKRNEGQLMPLVDAKGIVTAIRGVRMAAGLDKQSPVVALNLWSDSPMSRNVSPGQAANVPEIETWSDGED
jgi:hypothetical protein